MMDQKALDSIAFALFNKALTKAATEAANAALEGTYLASILAEDAPELLDTELGDELISAGRLMLRVAYLAITSPTEARWEQENTGDQMSMSFSDDPIVRF